MRQLCTSIAILFLVSACAVGNQYDYNSPVPTLSATTDKSVAVGTLDVRSYIVSFEKTPNFVGLQRGGFGNPFDVTTRSGNALADDMTQAFAQGLSEKGVAVEAVTIEAAADRSEAVKTLSTAQKNRSLLVTLREWKSDNAVNAALIYDIEAEVLDREGKVLASNSLEKREAIGSALGEDGVGALVGTAFKRVMADLLNNEAIVKALR